MRHLHSVLIAVCFLLGGCVGASDAHGGSGSGLIEVEPGTEPLAALESGDWRLAPAGCEDRLSAHLTFRVASLNDGLIAAVDLRGHIICVDTVESVQEELEEQGDEDRADEVGDRFLVAASVAALMNGEVLTGPSPQPDIGLFGAPPCVPGRVECGDPTPQPNTEGHGG